MAFGGLPQHVCQPQCLNDALFVVKNAAAALRIQTSLEVDGVEIHCSILWRGARLNRASSDGCNGSLHNHGPAMITVEAEKKGLVALIDRFGGKSGCLDRCFDEPWVVLHNGIILQWMEKDHFAIDDN